MYSFAFEVTSKSKKLIEVVERCSIDKENLWSPGDKLIGNKVFYDYGFRIGVSECSSIGDMQKSIQHFVLENQKIFDELASLDCSKSFDVAAIVDGETSAGGYVVINDSTLKKIADVGGNVCISVLASGG